MRNAIRRAKFFVFSRRLTLNRNINCKEAQNVLSASIDRLLDTLFGAGNVPKLPPPK